MNIAGQPRQTNLRSTTPTTVPPRCVRLRRREPAQMRQSEVVSERAKRTTRYVVLTAVIFAIGVAMATIGSVLRISLCFGGGTECNGVRPISEPIGVTLYVLGTCIALASPALAGGTFIYMRRRRRSGTKN